MLGRLAKQSPMFPPKKRERGEKKLGRFLLAIHWLLIIASSFWFLWFLLIATIDKGFSSSQMTSWIEIGVILATSSILFTLIYRIVARKWAFFPWQHVKD